MTRAKREAVRNHMELAKSVLKVICSMEGPNEVSKYKTNLWLNKAQFGPGTDGEYDDYFVNTSLLLNQMPDGDKFMAGLEAVYYNEDADFHTIAEEDMEEVILQILADDEKEEAISPEVQKEIDDMMKEIDEEIAAEEEEENKSSEDSDLTDDDKEIIFVTGMSTDQDPPIDPDSFTTTSASNVE